MAYGGQMAKRKFEHKHKDKTYELTLETGSDEINDPVDLFDALPHHVQQNHKLLIAFCHWYLNWTRRQNVRDKAKVKRKAKEIAIVYPAWKARQIAEHETIVEIAGTYSINQRCKWIREVVKRGPGRPKKSDFN
jgi:hypothetical protein